jgi:hypothetical protein
MGQAWRSLWSRLSLSCTVQPLLVSNADFLTFAPGFKNQQQKKRRKKGGDLKGKGEKTNKEKKKSP